MSARSLALSKSYLSNTVRYYKISFFKVVVFEKDNSFPMSWGN
jgi:hypothetical protein